MSHGYCLYYNRYIKIIIRSEIRHYFFMFHHVLKFSNILIKHFRTIHTYRYAAFLANNIYQICATTAQIHKLKI
jgi:hypothetical protein